MVSKSPEDHFLRVSHVDNVILFIIFIVLSDNMSGINFIVEPIRCGTSNFVSAAKYKIRSVATEFMHDLTIQLSHFAFEV